MAKIHSSSMDAAQVICKLIHMMNIVLTAEKTVSGVGELIGIIYEQ